MKAYGLALDRLLRRPHDIARAAREGAPERDLFVTALLSIVIGSGIFGAALATSRGGLQFLYSAVKLPAVSLITLVIVAPALTAIASALRRPISLTGTSVLTLAAAGRASLVLLALAPVVWLSFDSGIAYHRGILVACVCFGIAGLEALRMLGLALGRDLRSVAIIGSFSLVLMTAGGQTAWLLRPYVGRPSQREVPFLRGRESNFGQSVNQTAFSSMEIYR